LEQGGTSSWRVSLCFWYSAKNMAVVGEEQQPGEKLETFAYPGAADQSAAQSVILINAFCSNKKIFLPERWSL
jgi:hypothetical protein